MCLFDESRLMKLERYELLKKKLNKTDSEMTAMKIYPIHPNFRLITTANNPTPKSKWLTSELISMFHFHCVVNVTAKDKSEIAKTLFPSISPELLMKIELYEQQVEEFIAPKLPPPSVIANDKKTGVKQTTNTAKPQEPRKEYAEQAHTLRLSLRQYLRLCRHCSKDTSSL